MDDVAITCPECGAERAGCPRSSTPGTTRGRCRSPSRRAARNQDEFERSYPAQFICEAIDQTRGWFYSLMAVGTLVFGRSAYENVVCLGLIVDDAAAR